MRPSKTESSRRGAQRQVHWRADIQGLRAVALIALIAYHSGISALSGAFVAVDTFFVISGFLITQNLLRERAERGRIDLWNFYANRVCRLAPPAVGAVVGTLLLSYFVLPPLDRVGVLFHALAALLGVENINLARTGVDYLAPHVPSMFQQFWSLGVEEQFYLVWALILVIVCAVPRFRPHLLLVASSLTIASFAGMLISAGISGPWTYFGVHARAWEFGPGIVLAVLLARRAISPGVGTGVLDIGRWDYATAPIGLVMIVVSFLTFDKDVTPHPSVPTLLPVLGALLVVVPGPSNDPVRRILASPPLRWIGDRSYSFYLWHWPVIEIPTLALGRPLRPLEVIVAVGLVLLLGAVSYTLLERRASSWGRKRRYGWLAFAGAGTAVAVAAVPLTSIPTLATPTPAAAPTVQQVLAGPSAPAGVPSNMTPTLADALDDVAPTYADGCHVGPEAVHVPACAFGAGTAGTVVLYGDSHAAQWFTPVLAAAQRRGLQVITMTKSACPAATLPVRSSNLGREYHECDSFRDEALHRITEIDPDLVIIAGAPAEYAGLWTGQGDFPRAWERALASTLGLIRDHTSARLLLVHDTPRWSTAPNRCLSANIDDVAACAVRTDDLVSGRATEAESAAAKTVGASAVDPVPWLCTSTCSPVLWNVLAYRDTNHLTNELARVLEPHLAKAIDEALAR